MVSSRNGCPQRNIGFWKLFFIVFSAVGSGPAGIEGLVGAAKSITLACIAIGVCPLFIAVPEAFITLEMCEKYGDTNGGVPVWFLKVYKSRFWSFCSACFILLYDCSTSALVAEASILYVATVEPAFHQYKYQVVASTLIIIVAYFVCFFSVDFIAKSVAVLTVHTAVVFAVLVGFCCRSLDAGRIDDPGPVLGSINWPLFINLLVFNSAGYDCAGSVITFVRNPAKTAPRAMLAAAVAVGVMYETVYVFTYLGSRTPAAEWETAHFAVVAREVAGRWLQLWVIVGCCCINLQLFISSLTSAIYTLHGAAQLGIMPKWFDHLSARGSPDRALIACGVLSLVFGVVPFEMNLAFESVLYCLVVLGQVACFFSLQPAQYTFLPKSWFMKAVIVTFPAITVSFSLSVQETTVFFGSALALLAIAAVGAARAADTSRRCDDRRQELHEKFVAGHFPAKALSTPLLL